MRKISYFLHFPLALAIAALVPLVCISRTFFLFHAPIACLFHHAHPSSTSVRISCMSVSSRATHVTFSRSHLRAISRFFFFPPHSRSSRSIFVDRLAHSFLMRCLLQNFKISTFWYALNDSQSTVFSPNFNLIYNVAYM